MHGSRCCTFVSTGCLFECYTYFCGSWLIANCKIKTTVAIRYQRKGKLHWFSTCFPRFFEVKICVLKYSNRRWHLEEILMKWCLLEEQTTTSLEGATTRLKFNIGKAKRFNTIVYISKGSKFIISCLLTYASTPNRMLILSSLTWKKTSNDVPTITWAEVWSLCYQRNVMLPVAGVFFFLILPWMC